MLRLNFRPHPRLRPRTAAPAAVLAGPALAAIAGLASATPFTLRVRRDVHVTNDPTRAFRVKAVDRREAVVVGASGFAVYTFQGETTRHLICRRTSDPRTDCWAVWPPVSVASIRRISKQRGIPGRLGAFRNHGILQLTLNGRPLYYFMPDLRSGNRGRATGDELGTFGSIWHIVAARAAGGRPRPTSPAPTTTTTSPTPTTTSTTTTPMCPYPGYC